MESDPVISQCLGMVVDEGEGRDSWIKYIPELSECVMVLGHKLCG